jgi:hypothetical protein
MELKVETTTSFLQDKKHLTKSDRFQVVQPIQIAKTLDSYGFDLVNLKTGKAKNPERQDHQTTIARYRSRENFEVKGANFDIVFKVPHLYGAITGMLGLFRQVCSNGLVVGYDYEMLKVRHTGDPMKQLNDLIPALVAQREKLVSQVKLMQDRQVTRQELAQLSEAVAKLRIGTDNKIQNVKTSDLLTVRREQDQGTDLFTVMNVIQENIMRHGLRYQTVSQDENGTTNQMLYNKTIEIMKVLELNSY